MFIVSVVASSMPFVFIMSIVTVVSFCMSVMFRSFWFLFYVDGTDISFLILFLFYKSILMETGPKSFIFNYLVFLISRQQNLVCNIITSSSFLSDDFASSDFDVMSRETEVVSSSFLSTDGVVAVVGFLTSLDGASFWTTLSGEVSTI